jgi:two-component system response regulator FixJ
MTPEPTVFIVEDDAAMRDALGFLVETVGLKAETYACAQDFLAGYTPHCPGCLIADLRLPGMSGLELQAHLAARHSPLPVIIITGHGASPETAQALQAGAVAVLQKPFQAQALLDGLRAALSHAAPAREP